MTSSKFAGMILAGLTLGLLGCESSPPPAEHPEKAEPSAKAEGPAASRPFSSPVPPVEPSPLPAMPSTAKGDATRKDEPAKAEPPR